MNLNKEEAHSYIFPVGEPNINTLKEIPRIKIANTEKERLRSDVDFLLMMADQEVSI